ncbi:MAG: hypothetical protein GXP49_18140 [Deltaproteobacteria bacterium]|nr:hypothetical protein [Deltaproteobacteria bacterium]
MLNTYLQKYFWTFQLVVVGVCAYLSASILNNFVAASIDPYKVEKSFSKSARNVFGIKSRGEKPVFEKNPFCDPSDPSCVPPGPLNSTSPVTVSPAEVDQQETDAREAVGSCPQRSKLYEFARKMLEYQARNKLTANENQDLDNRPEPPHLAGVEPSSLKVKLLATVVASSPELSLATFEENNEVKFYRGHDDDLLMGEARVEEILRQFVFVVRGGNCEYIALSGEKAGRARTVGFAANRNRNTAYGKGIKKVGQNEYLIDRDEIENTLANLNKVATDARIVPSFKNGRGNGFKLFSIRPGSIYSRIGIQNGDVVQKINGYPMDSPEKALEVYQKLQDADHVTIDLMRRGRNITMEYTIR